MVVDHRTVHEIETTHRAGILETDSVRLLTETGTTATDHSASLTEGDRHRGIFLRFDGASHHLDFRAPRRNSVWLYPQTEVFTDLHRPARATAATCTTASPTSGSTTSPARPA